jgi:glycosyltransferase involved in cell wall biosynthesis
MIKVIHLGKFDSPDKGGIENHVDSLCTALSKKKIYVLNIISNRSFTFKKKIKKNFEVVSLPSFFKIFSTAFNIFLPFYVYKKIIFNKFKIIHIHHPDPLSHLTLLFIPKRIKIVLTWHSDIVAYKFLYFFYKPLLINFLSKVDVIVVATPKHISSSDILKNPKFKDKIKIVPYGIDIKYLNSKKFQEASKDIRDKYKKNFLIFTLSRHVYYKGIVYLIKAMYQTSNCVLLIGGTGPDTNKLKNLVKNMNLKKKVIFTGFIHRDKLPPYFHASDVFCLPSTEKSEAFGIAMAEAMACSKPIITTNLGTGMNSVCSNKTGITVEAKNSMALSKAIIKLQTSKTLRETYAKNAGKRIGRLYTHDIMRDRTISIYKSLITN